MASAKITDFDLIDREYPEMHPEYKDVYRVNFCKTADGARIIRE